MNLSDKIISPIGTVYLTIDNLDGTQTHQIIKNKVLRTGRTALANSLANQFTGTYPFYIARVLFSNGGTVGGSPRFIDDSREGLFNPVTLAKPVITSIDVNFPQEIIFTTVVTWDELAGDVINEMGLEMASGGVFSMVTFGDINKTSSQQLTFNWSENFIG